MILQSNLQTAIADLRTLAAEPGFQLRWQETVNRALAVMEGAAFHIPAEDPLMVKAREDAAAEAARTAGPNPPPDNPSRDFVNPAGSSVDQRNRSPSTAHSERPSERAHPSKVVTSDTLKGR